MKSRFMYVICGIGVQMALIAALVHALVAMLIGMGIAVMYWNFGEIYRQRGE